MRFVFRTDASRQIGTGHVMRCLTLARALRERGGQCHFICREHPGHLLGLVREQGFDAVALPCESGECGHPAKAIEPALVHAEWLGTDWRTDAEATRDALGERIVDWLVVDHYALDARWETALRPHCRKLLVIDDLADRDHECDLLLDQNLVADMELRYDGKVPDHCGRMLGPQYALLQPEYAELHPRTPSREGPIQRVLVYFGGADTDNLTGLAIAAFLSLQRDDITLDVVINPGSPHADAIREQVHGIRQVTLHTQLPSLAPLIVQVDFAIGAGGATSWERCCLGLPTLVITLAENQKPIAAELYRQGLILWLGHKDDVNEHALARALVDIVTKGLTPAWSEQCQHLVDGRGTERVRSLLLLNPETPLRARLARLDDEALILRWANDHLVRQNSFTTATFDPNMHRAWFRNSLRDIDHCRLYVVETEDGAPLGSVRFLRHGDFWGIECSFDARVTDADLGELAVQKALQTFRACSETALLLNFVEQSAFLQQRMSGIGDTGLNPPLKELSIAVCSGAESWINAFLPYLVLAWLREGHQVAWVHNAEDLPGGDICFFLSYGSVVGLQGLSKYPHNLVVHESNLPEGRGWSPMSWAILDGEEQIPVTLFEATERVDAGTIYLQEWIRLTGYELLPEWRTLQAGITTGLCRKFVASYPEILSAGREQVGKATYHKKRQARDSEMNIEESLKAQFNLLRIVDNIRYPAFFKIDGETFVLRIDRPSRERSY